MKIKKIMLITFLLLAVLTIGAVSASDDVASDNMTVSDDGDIIAGEDDYDPDDHYIEINEDEICLDEDDDDYDEEADIAYITLPDNAKGRFQILNGEEVVASLNVNKNDDDHWDFEYDDGIIEGTILLSDFKRSKVHDGDVLFLKFFELNNGNYVPIDSFTKRCEVSLTGSTMLLTEISEGMTEDDVDIQVKDINTTQPDENFINVTVIEREGFFIISVEGEDETIEIFKADLSTAGIPYVTINDENDEEFYRFAFSFTDIQNYIYETRIYSDFDELVEIGGVKPENEIYFEIYEDDEDEDTEIYSKTMTINFKDEMILFKDEDDEDAVDADYGETLDIIMTDDWNESELVVFEVRNDIKGRIVIYLNDTLAFNKTLTDLTPDEESDETYNYYTILLKDLNIKQAGEYIIRDFFYDEDGNIRYQYDDEDPETLILREPQINTEGNVTIQVNDTNIIITGEEVFITVEVNGSLIDEEIEIYIDENENPITVNITKCRSDENKYYIGTKELNITLAAGRHTLTITYRGNTSGPYKINLLSNIVIEFEDNKTVFTTFNDIFVYISKEEGETFGQINGTINITIIDSNGNIMATLEKEINDLSYDNDEEAYVISTENIGEELNGTYKVVARYFNGNEAETQTEGNVTFKEFDSKDYGTSIKDIIKDETDYAVTFTAIPPSDEIIIEIDGNEEAKVSDAYLEQNFDSEKGVYYIKSDKLKKVSDGPHSIRVYIEKDMEPIELASGNIIIDLKENIDPELTINITNIEEGNIATAVITTNSTFTGEVIVQVAGGNYSASIVNGTGSLPISGLAANTYTATAIFKSDGIFNDSTKTATFTVTSKPVAPDSQPATPDSQQGTSNSQPATPTKKANVIKLTLKKVKIKKSAKKLILRATLKINGKAVKGKKITFKFKGKTYRGKTNKKGVAKVTIKKKVLKKLKVGKKVTYTAKYSTKKVKRTVKVKK